MLECDVLINDKTNKPKVSIGLPVYNGEKYLNESLDSILAQTYTDFELIISDNASTDRTQEICLKYALKDPRIHYFRNDKNMGAAKNFNRVFELSAGEYFKWAAHDDIISPDFLLKCIEVLNNDPTIVLCFSKVRVIDEYGKHIRNESELFDVNSAKPHDRFGDIIRLNHSCVVMFGLIRSAPLGKTSLINSYSGSDRAMLAELGLLGRFYEITEYLFFNRDHPGRSINAMSLYMRNGWFDPTNEGHIVLPIWSLFIQYLKTVNHFPLNLNERLYCYKHLGKWSLKYYYQIIKDPIKAMITFLAFYL